MPKMPFIDKLLAEMRQPGTVICRIPNSISFANFVAPVTMCSFNTTKEIPSAFDNIEKLLDNGLHVVAMISYEAGTAFDTAFKCKPNSDFPLLFFAAYKTYQPLDLTELDVETSIEPFIPEITKESYVKNVKAIKKLIHDGDTYQTNYTFRMRGKEIAEPEKLFLMLAQSHPTPYAAFVNTGNEQIISLSPELFIKKTGNNIESRPMKGTAKRMLSSHEDKIAATQLFLDVKNRAENVMITDMVRNDIGKICLPGTVASKLFNIETYSSLHQMTSSVSGTLRGKISLFEIFAALFPPASITGAPKIRTSEIIAKHEESPRKIYTGSIGCISPNRDFIFNVAIRTIIAKNKESELGIGSGIVADSNPEDEWEEALLKSKFHAKKNPPFEVFETILWEKNKGFVFLNEHIARMRNSQNYFLRPFNEQIAKQTLHEIKFPESANFARVKLRVSQNGIFSAEFAVLEKPGWQKEKIKICLSSEQTDPQNVFLYHKTTNRKLYDEKYRDAISYGFDEIIFCNKNEEVTEGAISNIFIRNKEKWLTPPISCGLLPGIWREKTIKELNAVEKPIKIQELFEADEIMLGNSVRGGISCTEINIQWYL